MMKFIPHDYKRFCVKRVLTDESLGLFLNLNTPADIYVSNRENVPWLLEYYRNNWPLDMVVGCEFSSFKNHQAKRFKSLTWGRKHITRFADFTRTPEPNGLMDLWAQVFLLDGG
jgi:hypothetical protein